MMSTLLTLLAVLSAPDTLVTPLGPLKGDVGISRDGRPFRKFLGVPYAKPPVGRRRFQVAEPVKPWFFTKNCKMVKPPCIQYNGNGTMGQEDCLYLNVFTPNVKPDTPFPVMVYIHGGFGEGSAGSESSGNYLMDEDVVLVDVQYRLGILGFPNVENFPANLGLKDQVMALTWVKKNINSFGGDPESITIFGGGPMIHLHMLFSRGLKGVISHGGAFDRFRLSRKDVTPVVSGRRLGKMPAALVQSSGLGFGPSYEKGPGAFIKSDLWSREPKTPWILGVTQSWYLQEVLGKVDVGDASLRKIKSRLGDLASRSASADFQLYAVDGPLSKHVGPKYLYMYDGSVDPLVLGRAADESISRYFTRLWASFAKYSEPDVNYRIWTEGSSKEYLKIGQFSRMEEDFNTEPVEFWSEIFPN